MYNNALSQVHTYNPQIQKYTHTHQNNTPTPKRIHTLFLSWPPPHRCHRSPRRDWRCPQWGRGSGRRRVPVLAGVSYCRPPWSRRNCSLPPHPGWQALGLGTTTGSQQTDAPSYRVRTAPLTPLGIAQWIQHQTCDWKVLGLSPSRSGGIFFVSMVNFCADSYFCLHSTPLLPQ